MTPVHIHLMLNHLPVFATALAFLLLGYALASRHESYKKLSYVILIAAGLATPVVFFSGERSEELVEDIAGVSEHALHEHEEAGEGAMTAMLVLGAAALLQLILYAFPNMAHLRAKSAFVILLGSALAFGWAAWTAKLGGLIRHAEEMGESAAPNGVGGVKSSGGENEGGDAED